MLTQIWLAHPQHRSNLMILDPNNWDHMPEPLIAASIFKTPEGKTQAAVEKEAKRKETIESLLPWM
jgi:hypothetical protein